MRWRTLCRAGGRRAAVGDSRAGRAGGAGFVLVQFRDFLAGGWGVLGGAAGSWGWSSVRRLRVRGGFRGCGIRLQLPRGRLWGAGGMASFPSATHRRYSRGACKPRN